MEELIFNKEVNEVLMVEVTLSGLCLSVGIEFAPRRRAHCFLMPPSFCFLWECRSVRH